MAKDSPADRSRVPRFLRLLEAEDSIPAWVIWAVAVLAALGTAAADALAPAETRFAALDFVLVLGVTWRFGAAAGFGFSAFIVLADSSGRAAWGADISLALAAWNVALRSLLLVLAVILTSTLRDAFRYMHHRSTTDLMLDILNRDALMRRIDAGVADSARLGDPLSLLFLDLDGLKAVNDTYGHAEGDSALKLLAETARANVRARDALGRLGGDEFGIVLPGAGNATAIAIAGRIRKALESASDGLLPLSVSVGVATFEEPNGSAPELIEVADRLMYRAKRSPTHVASTVV